ncbi:hypothetical protein ACOSQ3_024368 [Xanthoceras sorbifolium]
MGGQIVHGMILRFRLGSEPIVGNALIYIYYRNENVEVPQMVFEHMESEDIASWISLLYGFMMCNDLGYASRVVDEMPERNSISWTAMITGYDRVTVVTVVSMLSNCANIGALDLGRSVYGYVNKCNLGMGVTVNNALMDMDVFCWTTLIPGYAFHGRGNNALEVFNDMVRDCSIVVQFYGLKPKSSIVDGMVDLLGRAGLLERAKDIIKQMPVNPDAVIWRLLLSACLVHGNLNLAEMAGEMVIDLEPDDDGEYALKIRKLMRNRKIKRKPGCSWAELNGIIHEFIADETMHHPWTENLLDFRGDQ